MSAAEYIESADHVIRGFCSRCREYHYLETDRARSECLLLMERLQQKKSIYLFQEECKTLRDYSTEYLFGDARGKMFGVLIGQDENKVEQRLFAFSGQYNGKWSVPGWVDPLFNPHHFDALIYEKEKQIKKIGESLTGPDITEEEQKVLKKQRKNLSKELMKEIHQLYECHNFMGHTRGLTEIFQKRGAPPSGTGDCCAPKLLHHAAVRGLRPISMAEFYWGRDNLSRTRRHGSFYPPCITKCEPILGYFLCGATGDE